MLKSAEMRKPESAKPAFKETEILCGIKEQVLPETANMKSVLLKAQHSLGPSQQPGGQKRNYFRISIQGGKDS